MASSERFASNATGGEPLEKGLSPSVRSTLQGGHRRGAADVGLPFRPVRTLQFSCPRSLWPHNRFCFSKSFARNTWPIQRNLPPPRKQPCANYQNGFCRVRLDPLLAAAAREPIASEEDNQTFARRLEHARCDVAQGLPCPHSPPCPIYAGGKLWVGDVLVRQFVREAWNQIDVLKAFQAQGWPLRIAIPPSNKFDAKYATRLKNTVDRLNYEQDPWLIQFHRHRIDRAISWEFEIPLNDCSERFRAFELCYNAGQRCWRIVRRGRETCAARPVLGTLSHGSV
jgi:hypothetical protein